MLHRLSKWWLFSREQVKLLVVMVVLSVSECFIFHHTGERSVCAFGRKSKRERERERGEEKSSLQSPQEEVTVMAAVITSGGQLLDDTNCTDALVLPGYILLID